MTGALLQKRVAAVPGRVQQITGRCPGIGGQGTPRRRRGIGPNGAIAPGSHRRAGAPISEAEGPLVGFAPGERRRAGQSTPLALRS